MKRIIPVLIASLSMVAMAGSVSAKELKAVGLTVGDMANPFFVAMGKGTEEAAKKINPNVKVTALSTKYDLNTQVGQIENFIANKIDLLLVNAVDPKAIAPVLKKARDAGIVVVAVDVGAEGADYTVMSDNVAAGANACDYIAKKLNGKGNDRGTQYRSAIFFTSAAQEAVARAAVERVQASGLWPRPIVTQIAPFSRWWPGEDYHQDYLVRYPNGYTCHFMR